MKKRLFCLILLLGFTLCACTKQENIADIFYTGGETVTAFYLIEDEKLSVSLPLYTNKVIKDISLKKAVVINAYDTNVCEVKLDTAKTSNQYKGIYTYTIDVTISRQESNKAVNSTIDKLIFEIDGTEYEYRPAKLIVADIASLESLYRGDLDTTTLKLVEDLPESYKYLPSKNDERVGMMKISIEPYANIKIVKFGVPGSFLALDDVMIDNVTVDTIKPEYNADGGCIFNMNCGFSKTINTYQKSNICAPFVIIYTVDSVQKIYVFKDAITVKECSGDEYVKVLLEQQNK